MNAMTKTSKSGGCGCGGSGKSCGCGCGSGVEAMLCGCGDVGCATCRNQGFVRPRFFAGQLLTEEDLQKMIDYVVAKNRLHNQRLWGDGVVCGLEVSCHPCGGGTVIVKPGYALDCCGNDLLLSCPQPLDINAMVRDLKRSLRGGHDCGEPCPPPKKITANNQPAGAGGINIVTNIGTGAVTAVVEPVVTETVPEEEEKPEDTTRHYCLYIRYCENLTDPVSPYATDEGCSYQSCQATRVSEGISFELRCKEECEPEPDILNRICECIGDFDSAVQMTRYSNSFYAGANLIMRVQNVVTTDRDAAAKNFVDSARALQRIRIAPSTMMEPTSDVTLGGTQGVDLRSQITVEEFEDWLSDIHTADAHLASYYLTRQLPGKLSEKAEGPTEQDIRIALSDVQRVATQLNERVKDVPAPELARGFYRAALKHTIALAAGPPAEPRLQEIAKGQLLVSADLESTMAPIAAMKEGLLDRLDRSLPLGDCELRFDVEAIRIPTSKSIPDWGNTYRSLVKAWTGYLKDCICAALNPPCTPCDDPAVLLACIAVKDCEVVEICNLKRKFVISGPALRYWLPPLKWLGDKVEELCCPDLICMEEEEPATVRPTYLAPSRRGMYTLGSKLPGRINLGVFEYLCGPRKKAAFWPRGLGITGMIAGGRRIVDYLRGQSYMGFLRGGPQVNLRQPVTGFSSELAAAIETGDFARVAAEALKVNPDLRKVMSEMAGEKVTDAVAKLRTSAGKDLRDVTRIKTENAELKKTVKELMDRVQKLEKGTAQ